MGLISSNPFSPCEFSDWAARLFFGLLTLYQGIFGIFVPSSIFHRVYEAHQWSGIVIIALLLVAGVLLAVDGLLAMLRNCASAKGNQFVPTLNVLDRFRTWFFLPPAFCYFATLVLVKSEIGSVAPLTSIYYVLLGFSGVVFCVRDSIVDSCKGAPHA